MTPEARAALLRSRFKSRYHPIDAMPIGRGIARANGLASDHPKRVRYVVLPPAMGKGFVLGPMASREPALWVQTPDAHEKPAIGPKRRQGEPVVSKLAKHRKPKLPVLELREPWQLTNRDLLPKAKGRKTSPV